MMKKVGRVAVGISGGVDSAVSALILKKKGYDVVGVFMKNWDLIDETGICSVEKDFCDAQEVCKTLQIPLYEANFVKEYWTEVFEGIVNDYTNGYTPNPDILCNSKIKFNHFSKFAEDKVSTDIIATGHYARNLICLDTIPVGAKLLKARDSRKDQTFFLSQIPQQSLCKTLFPLGNLLKSDVKRIAYENDLQKFAEKKESMGICFIGQRNFQNFIDEYVPLQSGNFIDFDTGKTIGKHQGKHNWTVGQRCRIGGCREPYYILNKSQPEDIIVVQGHDHPALYSDSLTTGEPFWIFSEPEELGESGHFKCEFRFQHGHPLMDCIVFKCHTNKLYVKLNNVMRALTPGQYAVFYKNNECLGSAQILFPGPSQFSLNYLDISNRKSQFIN